MYFQEIVLIYEDNNTILKRFSILCLENGKYNIFSFFFYQLKGKYWNICCLFFFWQAIRGLQLAKFFIVQIFTDFWTQSEANRISLWGNEDTKLICFRWENTWLPCYVGNLKVLCNAIACWLLLKYIRVNITHSSTVLYKYALYIFRHFPLIFFWHG